MRTFRCLVAAVLAAGIVTVVAAQPGGGGGFGTPDVTSLVLTNAALQEEIKVTAEQKEKFKPAVEKQTKMTQEFTDMFKGGKFDKDAFTELNEKRVKVAEEVTKIITDTLNADQKKRVKQIQIQAMAFNVFNDPDAKAGKGGGGFGFGGVSESQKEIMKEVQTALKLTDSQKSSVKGLVADFGKERTDIFKEAGIGGGKGGKGTKVDPEKLEAANKKVDKVRKEVWGKIEEALDDTQKKTWKDLVGEPFDTAKLRPMITKKD